jgi:hypothetical protein
MDTAPALEVKRVKSSEYLLNPGEYVFIEKRAPKITVDRMPLTPPTGFFKRIAWHFFGKKYELKQYVELLWPEHDAIILNCPSCNGPCATTKNHKIISVEPLTLEIPLTCPYCKTRSFDIKEGKIITAESA